jgi:hypothetical protein
MNRNLLSFTAAFLLLASCRQRENASQLKEISEGLVKANNLILDKNKLIYETLREKLKDPRTNELALIWLPRAEVVSRQSAQAKKCIESLKEEILKRSDSFKRNDARIVQDLLEINDSGDELFGKLVSINDSLGLVFSTDEFINKQFLLAFLQNDSIGFYKAVPLLSKQYVSLKSERRRNSAEWIKNKFANSSPLLATAMLNKIESDVTLTENFLIEYCNYQVIDNFCGYDKFWPIGSISSSCVKPGDTVEVTAGVGMFGNIMRPRITIDGTAERLNSKKVAVHTFIANGKPGKHTIPVKIEYMDSDGTQETATKEITYYIIDPK